MAKEVDHTNEDESKKKLTPEQYHILREKGVYKCAACGNELFSSETKFDSGTGWPSFSDPMNREHITLSDDKSLGMSRVEVTCKRCGSHLEHVFPDLPAPHLPRQAGGTGSSGQRYCINSACLVHEKDEGANQK